MAKATKIVIEFDDGTNHVVDPARAGSLFTSEAAARKCGHNPPYDKPPRSNGSSADTLSVESDSTTTAVEGPTCYWINGVIVCP
jgi:hypothetical protein